MPEGTSGNSLVALPSGQIVVTKFLDTRDKQAMQKVMAGQLNAATVYLWTPGKGISEVPGTQLSGDNGMIASPDGKTLYINAYGTKEIWKVPLSGQGERKVAKVDFNPDNVRWAPDGKIFVTGQYLDSKNLRGPNAWATAVLDPAAMAVTPLVKEPGLKEFDNGTTAVQVGKTLWFGTFRGDRVAYKTLP
jgi:sugar lactone lactonase YvrE